jgi:choline dehydrogenase
MFDYIVVGAGSAGCVVAGRLVAAGKQVALVEAGGSDDHLNVRIPAAFAKLFKTSRDWADTTLPQAGLGGRALFWPRGKMLGGSSSMNAQMWVPGFPEDYDGWAAAGAHGFAYADVRAYLEAAVLPIRKGDGRPTRPGIAVSEQRAPSPITRAFIGACHALGLPDLEGGASERRDGVAATRVTQFRGSRWSSADGYLRPLLKHPNLSVFLNAQVVSLLLEDKCARGVRIVEGNGGRLDLHARAEVILAAGTVGTPHLLMLSGIGDPQQLAAAGVPVMHELPSVGQNLQDHLMTVLAARCPRKETLLAAESPRELLRYLLGRRGMLTSNVAEAYAFVRTRPELSLPDVELIFAPVPFIEHGLVKPEAHGVSVGVVLLTPNSRGRITLQSADWKVPPRIDPGYLTDAHGADERSMLAGLELALRVLDNPAMRPYVDGFLQPKVRPDSTAALRALLKQHAETVYHPVGTCRMGSDDASVVDSELRVRGIARLRIADASVMPRIIRGHTHAPSVMIGEKAAALLLEAERALPARGTSSNARREEALAAAQVQYRA